MMQIDTDTLVEDIAYADTLIDEDYDVDHFDDSTYFPTPKRRLMAPTRSNTLKALHRMRETIDAGWTKGKEYDGNDSYCLMGAAKKVAGNGALGLVHRELLITLAPKVKRSARLKHYVWEFRRAGIAPSGYNLIANWNDTRQRTKKQVLDLIDQTIERLEAK